ncbi:MAG: hypothetical protein PHS37_03300 [Candidatus Omnitrophica bacterium]|nr:hypothetical protein [Candidatus Omnitrophota bacterium]
MISTVLWAHYAMSDAAMLPARHRIDDFSFTGYDRAANTLEKKFTIEGTKMTVAPARAGFIVVVPAPELNLKNVSMVFYEKGRQVSWLTAQYAAVKKIAARDAGIGILARMYEFTGGVLCRTEDGKFLSCDKLIWINKENKLIADGNCVIRPDEKTLKASHIITDITLSKYSIEDEIQEQKALIKRRSKK